MEPHAIEPMISLFGIVGAVVLTAALLSGVADRTRVPPILVFLALGTLLGPFGLGLVSLPVDSAAIRAIATLGLVLVLFMDAIDVAFADLKRHARLAALILGPATLLTAAAIALAAWGILGFGPAESAILGAALASTDPVLLRGVLRNPSLPGPARYALRLESGMNDAVLLPVVLVAMRFLAPGSAAPEGAEMGRAALGLFLIGVVGGVVVGLASIGALHAIRRRVGIRRDYESVYGLGVAITAFAAAEALGGSGFLAAFAAGLTIAALDVELCECFFDYGQATAELGLLFTFVALGSSAIWSGLDVIGGPALLFAAVALFVRAPLLYGVLTLFAPDALDRRSRLLAAWFGPRGLSSLLLVLLAVFAGLRGAAELFEITALVVLLSVVVHGGSQAFLRPAPAPAAEQRPEALPAPPAPAAAGAESPGERAEEWDVGDPERITLAQLAELERRGEPLAILDVRTESAYRETSERARGAVRVPPDRAVEGVRTLGLPLDTWLVSYCT
ncbi:MAG TPA: cation:proton antiporter [Thermoanaerobaculia bacterium]|nr:cation:proton antiporter [Thermoanaerobaculia bacterium]